jgi:hypothetical protein
MALGNGGYDEFVKSHRFLIEKNIYRERIFHSQLKGGH